MRKYPAGGVVIGALQAADAFVVYRNNGTPGSLTLPFAAVEFFWAIVSLVVLIRVKHGPTRVLALVFFIYNAIGWFLSRSALSPTEPIVIPMKYVAIGGAFGLVYMLWSAWLARESQ